MIGTIELVLRVCAITVSLMRCTPEEVRVLHPTFHDVRVCRAAYPAIAGEWIAISPGFRVVGFECRPASKSI